MSDTNYPPSVDGQPLSEEQKRTFDAFRAAVATFKAEHDQLMAKYWEAKANGVELELTEKERVLLSLFGGVSEDGETAQ